MNGTLEDREERTECQTSRSSSQHAQSYISTIFTLAVLNNDMVHAGGSVPTWKQPQQQKKLLNWAVIPLTLCYFCLLVEDEMLPVICNVSTDYLGTDKDKPQHMAAHQQSIRSGRHVVEGQCNLHMDLGHRPADEDTTLNHPTSL